ncbi:hypothetical protein G6F22_021497 [Rhizopus arrhizus]|nr:hypothetical protein G6F22_021497 [Rhizopus arrhizus]
MTQAFAIHHDAQGAGLDFGLRAAARDAARQQVGLAHETRNELGLRMLVHAEGRIHLRGAAVLHHHDAVADRQRFGLVMRDHHRRPWRPGWTTGRPAAARAAG